MIQIDRRSRLLWWLAAVAEAIAGTLELLDGDYLKASSLYLLGLAFLLLAAGTAPEPSRARAIATYALVLTSILLLVYRFLW